MNSPSETIHRRVVFCLPGYDPAAPRRYREMYRRAAAEQGAITGQSLHLNAAARPAPFYGWDVQGLSNGQSVQAEFWFLPWNDLVRSSMTAGVLSIYPLALGCLWHYLRSGALWALLRLRWQPMLATLYPVAVLLGQVVLAIGLAIGLAVVLGHAFGGAGAEVGAGVGVMVGLGLAYAAAAFLRRNDQRFYVYYLLHLYAFAAENARHPHPALAARLDALRAQIGAAIASGADEVLIVGHSLGAQLAVDTLGPMQRAGQLNGRVALLTLGQVIPMMSFLPGAGLLRRNLHDVAAAQITWVDVSSQADGGSFALCDPVVVSGVGAHMNSPKVVSAAFANTVAHAEKQRFFDRHFQYFGAFADPKGYDYFAITAGPHSLRARYANRAHSPRRDQRPLAPHQDLADV